MTDKFTEYKLPATAYATFDAESLKGLIVSKLSEDNIFTDQVYEGSNMSSFIDVIAYSYHVLMYYLNRTSTETLFTEATIYENVNRIVKMLNYSPIGYQTSTLSFKAFGSTDLVPGTYTIPRYTFINSNGTIYSTDTDISFSKNTENNEELVSIGNKHILYQGMWQEHQPMVAFGQDFEVHTISTSVKKIDHFHIHVYVQDIETGKFYEYNEVSSMFLQKPTDRVFEKRLNEKESYELKFGNDITGAKLNIGDKIHVYYLKSDGEDSIVGPNFLDDTKLAMFGTNTFNTIKDDVKSENIRYITFDNIETIYLTNDTGSTLPQVRESVDNIKEKAPLYFVSQDRLVTTNEYNTYIEKNYGALISSIEAVDNKIYMDGHFKYLMDDIGVDHPNLESRVMFNQLDNITASTNFNNVYVYCVPKVQTASSSINISNFLPQAAKEVILNDVNKVKMLSHEVIMMDPVYVANGIGLNLPNETITPALIDNTQLEIVKTKNTLRDDAAIISETSAIIIKYFANINCKLGQIIDIGELGASLLQIEGVDGIRTSRTDVSHKVSGISLMTWNPVYISDALISNQNTQLPYYKFPYLHDAYNLYTKIVTTSQ